MSQGKWPDTLYTRHRTDPTCCRQTPYLHRLRTISVHSGTISVCIGTTLTTGMYSQNRNFGAFSVITNAFARYLRCITISRVVPQQTEMVRKWTEMVRKQCKYGIRLQQTGSVLCRAYGPFSLCTLKLTSFNHLFHHITNKGF